MSGLVAHIIVRGDDTIGVGHILRCLTLARYFLENGCEVFVVTPRHSLTASYGCEWQVPIFPLQAVTEPEGWREYIPIMLVAPPSILFFDLLEPDLQLFSALSHRASRDPYVASLSSFLYRMPRFEDVTFYPTLQPVTDPAEIESALPARLLSGPEYFVIRPEFLAVPSKTFDPQSRRILISMGGADPERFADLVVHGLEDIPTQLECRLLLGRATAKDSELERLAQNSRHSYTVCRETREMAEWMAWADVAIINGGMTRYELAVVGTPFIAISLHHTQWSITEPMARQGLCINLGIGSQLKEGAVSGAVTRLLDDVDARRQMSQAMRKLIDGKGSQRIVEYVLGAVTNGGSTR